MGALAASGGGFGGNPLLYPIPVARLVDIQAFGTGPFSLIDDDDLLVLIEDAVERYGHGAHARPPGVDEPVLIWNPSLGATTPCPDDQFSAFAQDLDRIATVQGVVFVIAAGNYDMVPLRGWTNGQGPDPILNGTDRISSPGYAALGITVGSISDTSIPPSAAPADHPSPFSRRGPAPALLVKPEVVHYGGTTGRYKEYASGVRGPDRNGNRLKDIGTSFAAPRVAAAMATAASALLDSEPEMLKLLTVLGAERRGDHALDIRDSVNFYGFGAAIEPAALLSCEPWECTLLLHGDLRPGFPIQIPFPFPQSLSRNGIRRGHIRMALVYSPTLDPSKGTEYCQTNVTASLGRCFDFPERDPRRYRREVNPMPTDHGGADVGLLEQGWKWSPVKLYERTIRRMPLHAKEIGWSLTVNLLLRRELEDKCQYVRQPFWLGVYVADPEKLADVYLQIKTEVQAIGLAAPIRIRPQISA